MQNVNELAALIQGDQSIVSVCSPSGALKKDGKIRYKEPHSVWGPSKAAMKAVKTGDSEELRRV